MLTKEYHLIVTGARFLHIYARMDSKCVPLLANMAVYEVGGFESSWSQRSVLTYQYISGTG